MVFSMFNCTIGRISPLIRNVRPLSTSLILRTGDYEYEDPKSEEDVVNISYVQRDGNEKKIRGKVGDNVMYLAHRFVYILNIMFI